MLRAVDFKDENEAAEIVGMPFLKSIDADDGLAIQGLYRMSEYELLSSLINNPSFENGITDDQTVLIAAISVIFDPEEIRRMLSPGYVAIEAASIETELSPHLRVSLVRTGSQGQAWTAEFVKEAVEFVERTMQLPLPTKHVIVVLNDHIGTIAMNPGVIGINTDYEWIEAAYDAQGFQTNLSHILVHEIAHYYWNENGEAWIAEGLADTFAYLHGVKKGISPEALRTSRRDCEVQNLAILSQLNRNFGVGDSLSHFHCNYYLGQLLFLELYHATDEAYFSEKLRELYLLSLEEQKYGRIIGIDAVGQIFKAQADIVAKHWEGAINAPEKWVNENSSSSLDLIQWDQNPTYDGQMGNIQRYIAERRSPVQ